MKDQTPGSTHDRLLLACLAAVLVLLVGLLPTAAAGAASSTLQQVDAAAVQAAAADWLVGQYDSGAITTGGGLADTIFALLGSQAAPETVVAARADLEAQVVAYIGIGGADPGQLAKALLAIQVSGGDGNDVGGSDLESLVRSLQQTDGGDAGRFGSGSLFTQSLAIMALMTTPDGAPAAAARWLADRACPDGGFPFAPGPVDAAGASTACPSAEDSEVDTTALAVQALLADPMTTAAVDGGVDWLLGQQAADGGFLANSNSTGIAAQALRAAGEPDSADRAAAFVAGLQVPAGQPDAGAIRFRADDDGSVLLATTQGVLAFGAPAFPLLGQTPVVGEPCPDGVGVTVVVDLTFFDAGVQQGCAEGDPTSGLDALQGAGFTIITQDSDFGPFVCAIEGLPELACDQPFEGQFWAYFAGAAGGSWEDQLEGASSVDPAPGDVEGWRYGEGDPPAVPAPTPTTPSSVTRLAGDTRIATAIAISQDAFADGAAGGVVLTRDDAFADALAGTPLAVAVGGPLLITPSTALLSEVAAEIQRVLPAGGSVDVLGGPAAIDDTVVTALDGLGYDVQRISGADRIDTAIAVAQELGDPGTLLITTGFAFPDALAAGTAAAATGDGAVLLTADGSPHPSLDAYLASRPEATVFAIGGPAVAAYPDATPVVGDTRVDTAIAVAEAFFDTPTVVGLARQDAFADALAGGAHIATLGGPLLLTDSANLSPSVTAYLCSSDGPGRAVVFGGESAVSAAVDAAVDDLLVAGGCG